MEVRSTEFNDGGMMPERFGAKHANVSPPLEWWDAPSNARSFAIVCEDPDAPKGTFMHWAIYNIPPDVHALPENASLTLANSEDIAQATNDAGDVGYFGPKPPGNETHHYNFRLLALKQKTSIPAGESVRRVLEMTEPLVIDEADITGMYGNID